MDVPSSWKPSQPLEEPRPELGEIPWQGGVEEAPSIHPFAAGPVRVLLELSTCVKGGPHRSPDNLQTFKFYGFRTSETITPEMTNV